MGLPMAKHIAAAGHELLVFDVSEPARARAAEAGLTVATELGEFSNVEVLGTSLPATEHVEDVFFGDGGLASILSAGTVCAPVSGTSIHAEAASLVVMAGGAADAVETARPVLECFAAEVAHVAARRGSARDCRGDE
jgi:3-hydroxyisobutyrate dehydrogenase